MVELNFDKGCHVYSSEYDDIYFNPIDGRAESYHVFFAPNKILEKLAGLLNNTEQNLVITELGFGTGLNFFHLLDIIYTTFVATKNPIKLLLGWCITLWRSFY